MRSLTVLCILLLAGCTYPAPNGRERVIACGTDGRAYMLDWVPSGKWYQGWALDDVDSERLCGKHADA